MSPWAQLVQVGARYFAPLYPHPERSHTDMPVIGDKVKWKSNQRSGYVPTSLQSYLDVNGLTLDTAVFSVVDVFPGTRETMVDFEELDTRGGYYLARFEAVPAAAPSEPVADATAGPSIDLAPVLAYTQAQVDVLVGRARQDALDEVLAAIKALQG